jgi:ankyrin repeat protein
MSLQDYDGRSPLHVASSIKAKAIATVLIRGGALTTIKDNFGNIPQIDLIEDENHSPEVR